MDTCNSCRFWKEAVFPDSHPNAGIGACHRHAPRPYSPVVIDDLGHVRLRESVTWPDTYEEDWCGDHEKV